MSKKLFLLLILVLTIVVCFVKPKLHKTILIDSNFISDEVYEETQIDWAKWHSDVLNELIKNSKNAPDNQPVDTLNYIEFDVDNEQNIVNIKISSEPQQYSQQARKHFSSHVRNLVGSDILKFPQGSKRKITHFKAILKKSNKTQLSTPKDFFDYEKIKVVK